MSARAARGAAVALGALARRRRGGVRADVAPAPAWRLNGGVTTALPRGDVVYVGGAFTQLYTPSTSEDQFYDSVTGQVRAAVRALHHGTRASVGTPDGRGGLLVAVRGGDAFADANGAFAPPAGTTIVRIGDDCLWDRAVRGARDRSGDPERPHDRPAGARRRRACWRRTRSSAPTGFLRAQVAAFDAVTGARDRRSSSTRASSEIGLLGASADARDRARARRGGRRLHARRGRAGDARARRRRTTVLADESVGVAHVGARTRRCTARGPRRPTRSRPTT